MKTFISWLKLHWSLFLRVQLTINQHHLDNGLAQYRWQAIIWTNADPIPWRIYAALGRDELSYHLQSHHHSAPEHGELTKSRTRSHGAPNVCISVCMDLPGHINVILNIPGKNMSQNIQPHSDIAVVINWKQNILVPGFQTIVQTDYSLVIPVPQVGFFFSLSCAELISGNIKICLYFLSLLGTDMAQVDESHPRGNPVYPAYSYLATNIMVTQGARTSAGMILI